MTDETNERPIGIREFQRIARRRGVRRVRLVFQIPRVPPGPSVWEVKAQVLDDGEIYSSSLIVVRAFAFDECPEGNWWLHGVVIGGHNQLMVEGTPGRRVPLASLCGADELKLPTQRPGEMTVLRVANGGDETRSFRCTMHAVTPREVDA